MSVTTDFEHHELHESDDTVSQESCEEEATPTKLEFNDDILSIEYESFSCGFDVNVGLISMWICVPNMNLFLLSPSKLTSFLETASLNLLSLRALPIRNLL